MMFTLPFGITQIVNLFSIADYYYIYDYVYNSTDHAYVYDVDAIGQRPWWKSILFWWLSEHGFVAPDYADTVVGLSILINVRCYAEVIFWQMPRAIYRLVRKIVLFIMTNVFRVHQPSNNATALNLNNATSSSNIGNATVATDGRWANRRVESR